jgi:alpha-galactosidase
MNRLTRLLITAVTTTPLLVAGAVATGPGAGAATAYPPGGPDQTPVMGWSGWSFLRLGADASQVEGEARALVSTGLAAAGYRYVNIDDGWYQCPGPQGPNVDGNGRWVVNTASYPNAGSLNGIQALAAYVHSLGLKFGIYETAGISSQAVAQNTPILGTSDTADGIATTKPQNNYNCGGMLKIDYSKPGAQAYTDSVVDELASWGVARRNHQQQRPRRQGLAGRDPAVRPADGAEHHPGQLHHQARPGAEAVRQPVGVRA